MSFNGLIDEVEIFSRALTLAEIQSIFNAGSSGKCKTCVTPPANMVGWYPGDNNANDITASPDNGTLNGSATFAAGKVAQAFSLNGTTAYVSAPDVAKLDFGTGDFSIDAWINSSGAGTIQPIVDKRDGDNSSVFTGYSFFTFNGNLGVQLADGTASNFVSTTDVVDGTFHHVAVTVVRNSTTGGNLYVDGVSVLTFNPTARSGSLDNGAELRIGRNSPNTILDPFFQGLIDEVELFNRALSASEVQSIFTAAGTAGKCKCTITCPANVTTSNDTDQCGAVVNYTAPTVTGPCTAICSPASGSFFPKGTTTVTCSTTDPSGNIFSCSFTVTVNDTQPPAITCPANVTAAAPVTCPPATSLVVTYPAPMVSDNCPGVTSMCVPASGSTFPLGTTTVTCTATDTSGNTASCSFTVTVFSICVQDDSNPNKVVFVNLVTGDYLFCCDGTIYSGKGTVSRQGCIYTLVHNSPTRRVLIKVNLATKTGTASLQQPPGQTKCSITDRDLMNNSCVCGNQQALRRR